MKTEHDEGCWAVWHGEVLVRISCTKACLLRQRKQRESK
jgi:hypothetical protein